MTNDKRVPLNVGITPNSVYDQEQFIESFRVSKNKEIISMFPNDLVVECIDLKKMVDSTRLKHEIERLKKVKVKLDSENDGIALKERKSIQFQRNVDGGILDMNAYMRDASNPNCYMRPFRKQSPKYAKHFYLNIALSYDYNQDFERVLSKFKRAMPSTSNGLYDVMCFARIIMHNKNTTNKYAKDMVIVFPELSFNNAFFPKETKYIFMGDGGLSFVLIWASNLFANNTIANGSPDTTNRENVVLLQRS
jgi:hypothetical protein